MTEPKNQHLARCVKVLGKQNKCNIHAVCIGCYGRLDTERLNKHTFTSKRPQAKNHLKEKIEEVISEVGQDKVVAVLTDNAANMKKAHKILNNKFNKIIFIDLPWAKEIIDSVKDIVKFFKKHHIEGSCLNRIQIEKIGKRIQLQLPGNTRWGSHYFCLNSIIASKKALQVVVFENAVQRTITPELISKLVDTNSFWPATELLCSFLKLFVDMFKIFESDKPNLSSVYNEFIILGNGISKSTIPIKDEVLDIYNHYNEKLYHPAIAIAYFFDPRYKGKYLPDRISSISYIVEETVKLTDKTNIGKLTKEIMEYHAKSSRFSSNFLWLKEAIEDPITWWSSLEKDVPILSQ
ncbi:9918_t:CDS:2 [Entrophospora sp. SA101]|nr:9918_t:CDS:2 [Entrophospora sp. SA101]